MTSVKTNIVPLALVALSLVLAGCNTIKGAGRDVSATGKAVTDAAAETQDDMKK